MRRFLFLLPMLLLGFISVAQIKKDANNIAINWQIIQNSYAGKSQFLSSLNIQNKDNTILGNKGWKLYFNFVRKIAAETVTGNVAIVHVNGDLYYLQPTAQFTPIGNGASVNIEFVSGDWAVNRTDAPEGFYLIYDNDPGNAIPIHNFKAIPSASPAQFARNPEDHVLQTTPELIYEQNKNITALPDKDLQGIFPSPLEYKILQGNFVLDRNVKLESDQLFAAEHNFLKAKLDRFFSDKKATGNKGNGRKIRLKLDASLGKEVYQLNISTQQVLITASDKAGAFYGIQSLLSTFPLQKNAVKPESVSLQSIAVSDGPRFPFRGLMIDVGRNFQSKTEILKVLDLMAMYKLNVLHFHLNDDEGWRLEIPGLPELTEVGSKRGHITSENITQLPPSFGSGPLLSNLHGTGHYTKQDFIEILKYAHSRHIRVIPEIEAPGHARAAVRSMHARYNRLMKEGREKEARQYLLHDLNDRSTYSSVQNWSDNVMDVSLPSVYHFVEKVSNEIISMYKIANAPLETIHFGGDEVPEGAWEGSPSSLKFVKDHGLKDVNDLWSYFYTKTDSILRSKNLYMSGWEEAGMKPVLTDGKRVYVINPTLSDKNIHLNVWNNIIGWGAEDLAYKLANTGYKVVLSGVSNLYFDMAYQKAFDEPGYYWGEYVDIDKGFSFVPFNTFLNANKDKFGNLLKPGFYDTKERLTEKGKANIVGIQGLLWSETVKGGRDLEYRLMPKLLGLAERAWAADPEWAREPDSAKRKVLYDLAWSKFVNTIGKKELPRIDASFKELNYRLPPAGATIIDGQVHLNIQFPGLTVRYTTDKTEPTATSPAYSKPIPAKGIIKFRTFDSNGRAGKVSSIVNNGTLPQVSRELP